MAEGSGSLRNGPLLAGRPPGTVWRTIRTTCRRLYSVEDEFVDSFWTSLTHLVPDLRHTTSDGGKAIGEGLARAVLWAALTDDPPEVVEATFQNLGAEYCRRGFPNSGYHGAGHALLRAARDAQMTDWTSELSSGWVAFYSWLAAHLSEGARTVPGSSVSPGQYASAPQDQVTTCQPVPVAPPQNSQYYRSLDPVTGPTSRVTGPNTGPISVDTPLPIGVGHVVPPEPGTSPVPGAMPGSGTGQLPIDSPLPGDQRPHPAFPPTLADDRQPAQMLSQPTGPPGTLDDVLHFLRTRYFAGNDRALGAILTRVALRTGADLRAPRPDQRSNPAVIANVLAVLQVMGYVVSATAGTGSLQMIVPTPPPPSRPTRWWNRRRAGRGWRRFTPNG
jgi:hemoglobin-like flavoprotein